MTRAKQMGYLVVALLAVATGPAIAQQNRSALRNFELNMLKVRGGSNFFELADSVISLAEIEAVQQDLGVSDDVASKLTRMFGDYQAAVDKEIIVYTGKPSTPELKEKIQEIGLKIDAEFLTKVTNLLSADQLKRFRQIEFQVRLAGVGPVALLAPDVASELKLTDEQQQKLRLLESEQKQKWNQAGRDISAERFVTLGDEYKMKAIEILTAEQEEALRKLKGREFDLSKLAIGRKQY